MLGEPYRGASLHGVLEDLLGTEALLALAPVYFADTGRIEARAVTQDPETGEEILTWSVLTGAEEVPLALSPVAPVEELRQENLTVVARRRQVTLAGPYPDVTPEMRLVTGGGSASASADEEDTWNIVDVARDRGATITRLVVERVTP